MRWIWQKHIFCRKLGEILKTMSSTRYLRIILDSSLPQKHRSILAGTARSLALSHMTERGKDNVIRSLASGVIGPLVFLFTWSVLWHARAKGIQRLYFMARDGQILYEAAQCLIKNWQLDIEPRYLYCSRESLLLPSITHIRSFELNWLMSGYRGDISLDEICRRLLVTPDDLNSIVRTEELSDNFNNPALPLGIDAKRALSHILRSDAFSDFLRDKVHPRFDLTLRYFAHEGVIEPTRMAFVDTGWKGTSQYALSAILDKGHVRSENGLEGLYLGLNKDAMQYHNDKLSAFLFDWRMMRRDEQLYNFLCFEMLFSATHGRTLSYQVKGGAIVPVLQDPASSYPMSAVKIHHEIAVEFAERVSTVLKFDQFHAASSALCRELSREFICRPSAEEAEIYGDWPIASEIRERDFQIMAPPFDWCFVLSCATRRAKIRGFWPQASLIRGKERGLLFLYNLFLASNLLEWYRRFILRY